MRRKMLAALLLSSFWFSTQISSSHGQDWPDPLVELVSISTDTSTFYSDSKLRFNLVINRINGSTYSDITRVWLCPVSSWDGFLCNSGQFLVSTTPNSSDTNLTIESPALSLTEGNYLVTGVSFRNGAVLSGFTLMYPRSGVVTIGGIATNIPLVNLAQADFRLAQPEPEPTIEPETTPATGTETSTESESESVTESEPEVEPDSSPEVTNNSSDSTTEATSVETSDTSGAEESTGSSETTESTALEPENSDTTAAETSNEPVVTSSTDSTDAEPTNDEPAAPTDQSDSAAGANNFEAVPSSEVEPESTQPISPSQPNIAPEIVPPLQPNAVVSEVRPEVFQPEVVIPEVLPEPTPEIFYEVVLPKMQQLIRKSAIGGKVVQLTGEAKLVRKVNAGSGSLRLLATNDSTVRILLNQRVISELRLAKNQTITWFSRRPGKLKLQLSGDQPKLLLDFLKINGKMIKNPGFQMRS